MKSDKNEASLVFCLDDNETVKVETGKFADTEWYVQFVDPAQLANKHICINARFAHTSKTAISDQLMQALFLAHQARTLGSKQVTLLAPYLPYARQCRDVNSEQVGLLEAVGFMCKSVGINRVISYEVHEELCKEIFSLPLHSISLETTWYQTLSAPLGDLPPDDMCFVSPDHGGLERAQKVAALFKAPWGFVTKHRVARDQSEALDLEGDVTDKTVILIDDIIDTGRTAIQACEKVLEQGAARVFACFIHPVLSPGAVERLNASPIEKIWVCDTIDLTGVDVGEKITLTKLEKNLWKKNIILE